MFDDLFTVTAPVEVEVEDGPGSTFTEIVMVPLDGEVYTTRSAAEERAEELGADYGVEPI
jgi:hypothetical protein